MIALPKDLSYNQTLTLTLVDAPYYAVRNLLKPIKIGSTGFDDPIQPITNNDFALFDASANKPLLKILQMFKLVAKQGSEYYVHSMAEHLADPKKDIKELLHNYTLPGRFWQAYYWRLYLPEELELSRYLAFEMLEIEEIMQNLENSSAP